MPNFFCINGCAGAEIPIHLTARGPVWESCVMFQLISLEKIGFVARITLTRPERTNAHERGDADRDRAGD